jgi:hypothetical protein
MKRLVALALSLSCTAQLFAEDPAKFTVGAFEFQRPSAWAWVPVTSSMRKAQLKVPGATPEASAEVTFFHFGPGGGGGTQANIQRWLGQFQSAEGASKVEPQDIGGTKVTLVSTEGTYASGMPGGPTTPLTGYALLGAILESADGDVFVKMTGPASLVKDSRGALLDLLKTGIGSAKK